MVAFIVCLGKRARSLCALGRVGVTARARDERGRGRDQGGGAFIVCLGKGFAFFLCLGRGCVRFVTWEGAKPPSQGTK